MVIQRIQSLFLLVAAVLMGLLCFLIPVVGYPEGGHSYIYDITPLLVLDALVAVLLLVDIFLFKNLRLQMTVARVCTVLIVCSALIEAWFLYCVAYGSAIWVGSAIMLPCALVCTLLAYQGMKKDHKLLRSYNTLR